MESKLAEADWVLYDPAHSSHYEQVSFSFKCKAETEEWSSGGCLTSLFLAFCVICIIYFLDDFRAKTELTVQLQPNLRNSNVFPYLIYSLQL